MNIAVTGGIGTRCLFPFPLLFTFRVPCSGLNDASRPRSKHRSDLHCGIYSGNFLFQKKSEKKSKKVLTNAPGYDIISLVAREATPADDRSGA